MKIGNVVKNTLSVIKDAAQNITKGLTAPKNFAFRQLSWMLGSKKPESKMRAAQKGAQRALQSRTIKAKPSKPFMERLKLMATGKRPDKAEVLQKFNALTNNYSKPSERLVSMTELKNTVKGTRLEASKSLESNLKELEVLLKMCKNFYSDKPVKIPADIKEKIEGLASKIQSDLHISNKALFNR